MRVASAGMFYVNMDVQQMETNGQAIYLSHVTSRNETFVLEICNLFSFVLEICNLFSFVLEICNLFSFSVQEVRAQHLHSVVLLCIYLVSATL